MNNRDGQRLPPSLINAQHFGGHRIAPNAYEIEMFPPLEDFPTGDAFEDAKCINQAIEGIIRKYPAQYLWTHRRFKTHPKGKNFLYEQS